MNKGQTLLSMLVAAVCVFAFSAPANGHSAFKKQLSAKYPNKKISCNACHVDKQPKTTRNNLGKLFTKTMGNEKLTSDWKELKGAEKKEYEKTVMVPAFDKAYEKVQAMTMKELIEAGLFAGIDAKEEE